MCEENLIILLFIKWTSQTKHTITLKHVHCTKDTSILTQYNYGHAQVTVLVLLNTDSFENVESAKCGGYEYPGQLGVPVQFLYLFLSLVNEEQLRRNAFRSVRFSSGVLFNCQVPLYNLYHYNNIIIQLALSTIKFLLTWSSSPAEAKTVESSGCHSTDVMAPP